MYECLELKYEDKQDLLKNRFNTRGDVVITLPNHWYLLLDYPVCKWLETVSSVSALVF